MDAALDSDFGLNSVYSYSSAPKSEPALPHQPSRLSRYESDKISRLRKYLIAFFLGITFLVHEGNGAEVETGAVSMTPQLPSSSPSVVEEKKLFQFSSLLTNEYATGDWAGWRTKMKSQGIELGLTSYNEVWGNTTGGLKTGSVYAGALQGTTAVDFEKLFGWTGGSFFSSWFLQLGQDPCATLVNNLFAVSSIFSYDTFRNTELWIQQDFLEHKYSVRVGQLAASSEFVISDYALFFENAAFSFPPSIYTSIPNGGPNSPMGAPGLRLKVNPTEKISFLAAMFQGDVFPPNVNNHGFYWNLHPENGFLYMMEGDCKYRLGLPGQIKFGTWFDSGTFNNLNESLDTGGDESDAGSSRTHHLKKRKNHSFSRGAGNTNSANSSETTLWGNYGIYGIIDQMIYRKQKIKSVMIEDPDRVSIKEEKINPTDPGIGVFLRAAFEPSDRNLLTFYTDTGFTYKGIIPTRDDDTFGVAFAFGQLSGGVIKNQAGSGSYDGNGNLGTALDGVGLGYEMTLETSYNIQVTPSLAIQPDLQYVIHPGGSQDLGNAFILGIRATVVF
jgi:porin